MKNYQLVIFDLDGTLFDTIKGIKSSMKYALKMMGKNQNLANGVEKVIGPSLLDIFKIQCGFNEEEAQEAVELYRENYSIKGFLGCHFYKGIEALIRKLKKSGRTIAIATMKPAPYAKKILEAQEVTEIFSVVSGPKVDLEPVRKADLIKVVLKKIPKFPKNQIVMIGDKATDILAAEECGIDSIAVNYGYGHADEFDKCHPTFIADDAKELSKILFNSI